MNFKKWVKSIQTAGYNGARTVCNHILNNVVANESNLPFFCRSVLITYIPLPNVFTLISILRSLKCLQGVTKNTADIFGFHKHMDCRRIDTWTEKSMCVILVKRMYINDPNFGGLF